MILLAVLICMSFGTILMKMALFEVAPLSLTWLTVAVGMVVMAVYTFVIRGERIPARLGRQVWYYNLRILRSYEASILGASSIIWTALLAALFLGETLSIRQIFGMALMILGLILVQIRWGQINRENLYALTRYFKRLPGAISRSASDQDKTIP